MSSDVRDRLRELARHHAVRVEYQCSSCGYLLYRRLDQAEAGRLLEEETVERPLFCPACEDKRLTMVGVSTERDWTRQHADHTHGG